MAYVVARRDPSRPGPSSRPDSGGVGSAPGADGQSPRAGATRYEIRESIATAAGPRSRSLATFRILTDDVIALAAGRAQRSFDADTIRARAAALGAPTRRHAAAATASSLLAQLRAGERLPPALAAQLRLALPAARAPLPDSLQGATDWIGVDDEAKGRALRDLLDVASRIPTRRRSTTLAFPRLVSGPRS